MDRERSRDPRAAALRHQGVREVLGAAREEVIALTTLRSRGRASVDLK
jgi:hypothetical protein